MKKLFSMLLVVIMITVLITPGLAQAATIKISKAKATLEVDATLKLKITGTDSKATWSSSKKTVATVSSAGTVTAKVEGTATITATVSSRKYTCKVTVINSNKVAPTPTIVPKDEIKEYEEGTYKIGKDMPEGEYVLFANTSISAYFAICSDSKGRLDSIIANDNFEYNSIVTVKEGQYLELSRCYAVSIDDAIVNTSGSGMFKVGKHIESGEYKIICDSDIMAYIAVLSDSTHDMSSIIANDNFKGTKYITVEEGQYLLITRCHIEQ